MKPDDLGPHWENLFANLRIWRDKAEAQKKEVEAYELFVGRSMRATTPVLAEEE